MNHKDRSFFSFAWKNFQGEIRAPTSGRLKSSDRRLIAKFHINNINKRQVAIDHFIKNFYGTRKEKTKNFSNFNTGIISILT